MLTLWRRLDQTLKIKSNIGSHLHFLVSYFMILSSFLSAHAILAQPHLRISCCWSWTQSTQDLKQVFSCYLAPLQWWLIRQSYLKAGQERGQCYQQVLRSSYSHHYHFWVPLLFLLGTEVLTGSNSSLPTFPQKPCVLLLPTNGRMKESQKEVSFELDFYLGW